jgi:hypothetical protein
MRPLDGDAVATALARYVRDFLPETAYGVAVIREGTDGEALLGVYGKPGRGGRVGAELALYEALLAKARVDVVGRGLGPRGQAWTVVVRAGQLVHPLRALLADLLDRRVVGARTGEPPGDRELADQRVRAWCDWWHSLSG